jgi:DNA-binding NarL/FixJ family response regulator
MKSSANTAAHQIRAIIADDHPVVRTGLVAMLRTQKDIKVVAEATDGAQVCERYDQLCPDVLMLDLRMPKKDGLQVVTELMSHSRVPKPRIIVMTTYEREEDIRRRFAGWRQGLPGQRG